MLPSTKVISLFLASPSDVPDERAAARRVIDEINRTSISDYGLIIRVVGWDTHSYPQYGSDSQSVVNSQIAEMGRYQLFLGIMRDRMGTPTPRAASGTVEEFERAAESLKINGAPEIMFYFGQHGSPHGDDQREAVDAFRSRLRANGLAWTFTSSAHFEELFRQHLRLFLSERRWRKGLPTKSRRTNARSNRGFCSATSSCVRRP